jgi:mRNA-degrading endonuclease RelE of RelBE toxin-antitoxin system
LHDYKQIAYSLPMRTVFFETTSFTATVGNYLTDDEYRALQSHMQLNPQAGDVMPRTGGFRKLRWADGRRGKGRRGGLRVIYYWLMNDGQFWMFAIYDKDELEHLTADQEKVLKKAIETELRKRGTP